MSEQFESIKKGLEQLIAFESGDTSVKCRVRKVKIPNIESVKEYKHEHYKHRRNNIKRIARGYRHRRHNDAKHDSGG